MRGCMLRWQGVAPRADGAAEGCSLHMSQSGPRSDAQLSNTNYQSVTRGCCTGAPTHRSHRHRHPVPIREPIPRCIRFR